MKLPVGAGVALLSLTLCGSAWAGSKLDANDDGKITVSELQAKRAESMMKADSDHDGRISKAEFGVMVQKRTARTGQPPKGDPDKAFQRMDINGDGFITRAELDQQTAQRFAKLDAGHAGFITVDQLHRPAPAAAKPRRRKANPATEVGGAPQD